MDRETLTAAFAQLWATMDVARSELVRYSKTRDEAEEQLNVIIEALRSDESFNADDVSAAMDDALSIAGLKADDQIVNIVRSELAKVNAERRVQVMRIKASMN